MSSRTSFPYEIIDLDPETRKKVSDQFSDLPPLVQVGPQKMLILDGFIHEASYCHNFPFRESDVVVMGHPRSGTTMTQELLWVVLNSFNFPLAAIKTLNERVPWIEFKSLWACKVPAAEDTRIVAAGLNSAKILEEMTTRRVMKTHLHFNLLPENLLTCGCKVIYVARNPKDVAVSFYHLQRNNKGRQFTGNFENFLDLFMSNLTLFTPYWTHLHLAWERRSSPNMFFFFYEDFLQNKMEYIEKILEFVGEKATPFQLDLLDFLVQFENFRKYLAQGIHEGTCSDKNTNENFIRKGNAKGWTEYFTEKMNAKMDKWIQENLERTGIKFPEGLF